MQKSQPQEGQEDRSQKEDLIGKISEKQDLDLRDRSPTIRKEKEPNNRADAY